ncbi:MAG: CmcI family methyltransferase, partial [Thermoanaerobaculia bacterium]
MRETKWSDSEEIRAPEFDRLDQPEHRQSVVDQFHYLYYHQPRRTWLNTNWMGVPVSKCPFDLWVYQEILFEVRPD